MVRRAAEAGDDGTNDLLVSDVMRGNELQVWSVADHVVEMPLVQAVQISHDQCTGSCGFRSGFMSSVG